MSLFFGMLIAATKTAKANKQEYGPFFYPTGANTDPISITYLFDSTHFYLNMLITGEYWFSFGFTSQNDCYQYAHICTMLDTESIIFGYYVGLPIPLTTKIFKLGHHNSGNEMSSQYLQISVSAHHSSKRLYEYIVSIIRPYDPYLHGGDIDSYKMSYPKVNDEFCWLWAQGNNMLFNSDEIQITSHINKGHQCITFDNEINDNEINDNEIYDNGINDNESAAGENSWLEQNLTWILIMAAIAVILCFCCALICFWYSQHRRTRKRREKRLNMLNAEKFKSEQGLNIDAENKTKQKPTRGRLNYDNDDNHDNDDDDDYYDSESNDEETDKNETETAAFNDNNKLKKRRKRKPRPRPTRKRKTRKEPSDHSHRSDDSNHNYSWNDSDSSE